jgi:ABC-type transporter Mla maintaining outer membrane lipid asymmetry ATPase subunit MlaF
MSLAIADRACVIETGRVVMEGSGAELLARREVVERYLGAGRDVAALDERRRGHLAPGLRRIFQADG